ncbi:MAG: methyltransferase [Treponema sp.]|nr:methyltransferase [Treponema sp.]
MAIGEIFSTRVEGIVSGGRGLARKDGLPVFIGQSSPGDRLRARIVRESRDWAEAEPLEILEASPLRVEPLCPRYGICGGCSLQHLAYDSQLEAKKSILKESFARIGALPGVPEPAVFPSPPWEYRNRMQFHRLPNGRGVGLMARKGAGVVPLSDCPAADRGIRDLLASGLISPPPHKDRFTLYSRDGLLLREGGPSRGRVKLRGEGILMDAALFFQSNAALLERLIGDLLALAGEADRSRPLADIYCGVGTFAFFLKGSFPRIDLVEENRAALALARENVGGGENGYFAMKDEEWARGRGRGNYGFIVADPPRQGLSPAMRAWLAGVEAPILAYVSCDSSTLARDSRELLAGGWSLEGLGFYDFYPQTAHIESLAVFKREFQKGVKP